jgi:pimeloyl-ACP methyl ester carboxylesterase
MFYTTLLDRVVRKIFGEPAKPPDNQSEAGLVVLADGVGGLNLVGTSLRYVLPEAGLAHTLRVVPWGHGFGRWHLDLTNVGNQDAHAQAIAAEVESFRASKPGAPVFLIGKSGGSGVIVRALEALPDESIERAILLAPALSPSYDLSFALRALRTEMVVFWSPLDVFVLGVGTRIFGTIDRRRMVSAGLVGFQRPDSLDDAGKAQYAKLRQVRWHPRMSRTGYMGGHVGLDLPAFLKAYVAPLLVRSEGPTNPAGCQASPALGR